MGRRRPANQIERVHQYREHDFTVIEGFNPPGTTFNWTHDTTFSLFVFFGDITIENLNEKYVGEPIIKLEAGEERLFEANGDEYYAVVGLSGLKSAVTINQQDEERYSGVKGESVSFS